MKGRSGEGTAGSWVAELAISGVECWGVFCGVLWSSKEPPKRLGKCVSTEVRRLPAREPSAARMKRVSASRSGIGGGAGGTLAADGSVDEEVGEFGGVGVGELSVVEEFDLDIAVVDGECSEVDELVLAVGIELCDAVEERFLEA